MQTWTNSQQSPLAAPAVVALASSVAGDAVADALEAAELVDVEVQEFAGVRLLAAHRLGRFVALEPVDAMALEDPADGGGRDTDLHSDLLAGLALAAQHADALNDRFGRREIQPMRPR